MKTKIAMIVLLGLSFAVKAQQYNQLIIGNKSSIPPFVSMWIEGNDNPGIFFNRETESADRRLWSQSVVSDEFRIMTSKDNFSQVKSAFLIKRGSGIDIDYVSFPEGNIGIGTLSPSERLEVVGNIKVDGDIINETGSGSTLTLFDNDANRRNRIIVGADDQGAYIKSTYGNYGTDAISFRDSGNNRVLNILANATVGIGTGDTKGYNLAVAGSTGIVAEKVTVKLQSSWPDYVFANDYQLPTLEEVEQQIKEKGHLANIPSAREVQENGVELGDINKKLLEKVEELTLYTIQQRKRN